MEAPYRFSVSHPLVALVAACRALKNDCRNLARWGRPIAVPPTCLYHRCYEMVRSGYGRSC